MDRQVDGRDLIFRAVFNGLAQILPQDVTYPSKEGKKRNREQTPQYQD
jgi:hypothetical protein